MAAGNGEGTSQNLLADKRRLVVTAHSRPVGYRVHLLPGPQQELPQIGEIDGDPAAAPVFRP